jgi:hypothetical protein
VLLKDGGMALEEIKSQLCGKWKLDRSENFDEFLKELGKSLFTTLIYTYFIYNFNK